MKILKFFYQSEDSGKFYIAKEQFMSKVVINTPNHFIFDFVNELGQMDRLYFGNPIKVIAVTKIQDIKPALEEIQKYSHEGKYAAGYISYEAAPAFDAKMKVNGNPLLPLLYFGIYEEPIKLPQSNEQKMTNNQSMQWNSKTTRNEYNDNIGKIKEYIASGDTYQVNYTLRLQASYEQDSYAYYEQLRKAQRANYGAYLNIGRYKILSLSPELFFELREGVYMKTSPMKGTIRRGVTLEEDLYNKDKLTHSLKDQAENVMIVDLLRNDLSKISKANSVKVPNRFVIEKYPTVYQMTSTVTSELREHVDLVDIFSALFPCGSITGAPKLQTMEIITELEQEPREVYCGSIGYIAPHGYANFNVAIRTVVIDEEKKQAVYGVGGGITWDSKMGDEYQEAFDKAAVLSQPVIAFELMETMRFEKHLQDELAEKNIVASTDYTKLSFFRHLNRIKSSAQYFDIPFDREEVVESFKQYTKQLDVGNGDIYRLNLFVDQQGHYRFKHQPFIPDDKEEVKQAVLASSAISSSDLFLYHKTTYREVYHRHRAGIAPDVFDVLLWNEREELTEFTIGNLVVKQDGKWWTPPVSSGLLAGTFRGMLLEQEQIEERVIHVHELPQLEEIWLVNSLRGWVKVVIV